MELWHPRAFAAPANKLGVIFFNYPVKIVLHTTESTSPYSYNPDSYYGNPYWPHATIDEEGIHQHLGIDVGGYALYRETTPTNAANAIQCEIVWHAAQAQEMPEGLIANIADWINWVGEQYQMHPLQWAEFVAYPESYGVGARQRFSDEEWLWYFGVCGHEHVPSGNDHGDPGDIPVGKIRSYINGPQLGDDFLSALSEQEQRELYEWTRDNHQYMSEEKGGGVDTLLEAVAGVVNGNSAKLDLLVNMLTEMGVKLYVQFDPEYPARKDITIGVEEFVKLVKGIS